MPVNFETLCSESSQTPAHCDRGCNFLLADAKLIAFTNNDEALLGQLLYLDTTKTIRRGKPPKSGYLLACPICGTVHVEGFEESSAVLEDNGVHRKITIGQI